ncbi:hypothetical protein GYMLUDRAFT_223246 [Collybiopsis luxurians FD-317 M1]|uniref:DUF6534 domain-containing protein n=1 Tax=Collybiopsis luxurians FD-317 M1 TaxID=944289 RepID=A0A0D0CTE0_9AGAR|nr:hypothetical protein GYMLUDRAFT_223246 [Collybiopsis luxurians FD-317 M1]
MTSPATPQLVLGPYYFGVVLNTLFYGVLALQTLIYYQGYKSDRLLLRLFVFYLFAIETINSGMILATIYQPLVGQFGTDLPMTKFPTLLPGQPYLATAISVPVQLFYAWRIHVVIASNWIPALICLSSLTSMAGGFWTGIQVHRAQSYANKHMVDPPAIIWSICASASDIIICISLIASLIKRKTGMKNTDDVIDRIIRTTLQTGAVTQTFAILDNVLFLTLPNSALCFTFDFVLPKLYSNAIVSTLNARKGTVRVAIEQSQDNILLMENLGVRQAATIGTPSQSIAFRHSISRTETTSLDSELFDLDTQESSHREARQFGSAFSH